VQGGSFELVVDISPAPSGQSLGHRNDQPMIQNTKGNDMPHPLLHGLIAIPLALSLGVANPSVAQAQDNAIDLATEAEVYFDLEAVIEFAG
jgi:hypothetical protein